MNFKLILRSLGLLVVLSFLSSCEKEPESVVLTVKTSTLSITVGEQATIEYSVQSECSVVTFVSDHPEIASVSDQGVVSGVAEGQCTISVKAGAETHTVAVTVTATPIKDDQQMPLLKFGAELDDEGRVTDPEIIAYEAKLGRKPMTIHYTPDMDYVGFANPELSTITGTIYGISVEDLAQTIGAYSTEPVEECPKTREMLQKLGFTTIEEIQIPVDDKGNTAPALKSVHSKNPKLTVYVVKEDYPELRAKSYLEFIQERGAQPPYVAHEILPDIKDFPAISDFKAKDADAVKAFEERLALRTLDPDLSEGGNLWYSVKREAEDKTNIDWAYYVFTPDGGKPFINIQLLCIEDNRDLQSDAFKKYLKTNGFDQDYTYDTETNMVKVYNAQGDMCQVFLREFDGIIRCLVQIVGSPY